MSLTVVSSVSPSSPTSDSRHSNGLIVLPSSKTFDETIDALTTSLHTDPKLTMSMIVDHHAAAASRGLDMWLMTEMFFGNPLAGTPLMKASQSAGIDLPQKMITWANDDGQVFVAYNAPSYVAFRHDLDLESPSLQASSEVLATIAGDATGELVEPVADAGGPQLHEGLITASSPLPATEVRQRLLQAIDNTEPVNLILDLSHDKNANTINFDLLPTNLIMFGNPSLGTQLMQSSPTAALDLPEKMLITEDADGKTSLLYNDPIYIAQRHGIEGQDEVLAKMAGALAHFADMATS